MKKLFNIFYKWRVNRKQKKETKKALKILREFKGIGYQKTPNNTSYYCHLRNRIIVI